MAYRPTPLAPASPHSGRQRQRPARRDTRRPAPPAGRRPVRTREFAHGHGVRRSRYRGQPKAHLQHVLTAIAVNIERLSCRTVAEETSTSRQPTAFQTFLDQQRIPRSRVLANPRQPDCDYQDHRQSQANCRPRRGV
ncbi:transposase [Streptomyces sp. LARHCF249]